MATDQVLEALLQEIESDRVERKSSISDKEKIQQAICAFANDLPDHQAPGYIFVVVKDDGTCAQMPVTDKLLLTLSDWRSNGSLLPFPLMNVEKRILAGCEIAVIEVFPAYNPPVRCEGRIWVRIGPRRAVATADEERRLTEKRRAGNMPFDQHPVHGATLDDLDLVLFQREYLPVAIAPEVLQENQRSILHQLASLHFLTKDGVPNVGAIIVLGKEPRMWIPGAYIQFLRIEGRDLTAPIRDQKEIQGSLLEVLREVDRLIEAHITVATDIVSAATETHYPDYPKVALQQLIRNAVLHRTYEGTNTPVRFYWFADRIEITSPGDPYGQVNAQNFGKPGVTDYRNPLLAEAMKALGFVQRFGVGIPTAQKALKQNGNPRARFQIASSAITTIIRRHR